MEQQKQTPKNLEKAHASKKETSKQLKARFIKAFGSRLCNVSATCEVVGIARQTFYTWMDKDDKFKKDLDDCREKMYDDLETAMLNKAVVEKETTMLIWLSKTKMKHRGYVEKVEQDVTVSPFLELMKSASVPEK